MKVLYLSGIPAPYRVDLFNEMGKTISLTVAFLAEYQTERNKAWQSSQAENFQAIFLNKGALNGKRFDLSMVNFLKAHASEFDVIVVHGYSFTASILAIAWMKCHGISYGLEADGAIIPEHENYIKLYTKRFCIKDATFCLSSGKATTNFFAHYGAKRENCFIYPFSSISSNDIVRANKFTVEEKKAIREKLGISEEKIIITVGRFSYNNGYGKGYDLLMKVAERLEGNVGIYFIGDEPTKEFNEWKEKKQLSGVHFVGFKGKDELYYYYACADLFVLLTRGDVWGLAINEAMMFGLPVITTTKCLAGLELVQNNVNGTLVDVDNEEEIFSAISGLMNDDAKLSIFGENSIKKIAAYTLEASSEAHNKAISDALGGVKRIHKELARAQLNIDSKAIVVLYVGQMIYRKGVDVLLNAACLLPKEYSFYLIGGKPTEEYKELVKSNELTNIMFIDFMTKDQLKLYYQAADVFVLPTREDIWGLVINEALSYGLATVSTEGCVAACEMLKERFIVPVDEDKELASTIRSSVTLDKNEWEIVAFKTTAEYTIENSAKVHIDVLSELKDEK
ncbi:MAG: glycosyltransferase [Clostridia bacterium]|nr:glycosyltransferase [Clostridia bacterium]